METQFYEVLDGVGNGIRIQAEFQPRANFSLGVSGIPFIRALVVHNETGRDLPGLELTGSLAMTGAGETVWSRSVPGPILNNSATRIDDPRTFDVFTPVLSKATESTMGTLDLHAMATGETEGARVLAAVEVSAFNEWLNFPGLHPAIAAFVQPNTRMVTRILRAASDLLMKKTNSGSLQGYQAGAERAHEIGAAIYEAIRGLQITYINPPASFERTGQKVRTTEQVLTDRFGTCADLAVLYAACIEAAGLFPVIFITRTHALAGFYSSQQWGETAAITQVNVLTNMVELGAVVPVELTGVGPGAGTLSFRKAHKVASDYFRNNFDQLQTMVDITKARLDGIRPMPQFTGGADEVEDQEAVDLDRPFVAKSSRRNLSSFIEAEEVVRGVLEREDHSPPRLKSWKRDLLDLTLRNPLLNLPNSQKVLDLLVPGGMLPMLDDVVHSGKSVKVIGGTDSTDLQKLAGIRVASEVAPEQMIAYFQTTRTVFSTQADAAHRRQLRAMKREADTLEQESGSNYLYLTLGALVHTKADGSEARAPLFLLPVRLTGGLAFTNYAMKLDGAELAQPNLCLLQWLTTTKGLDLTELANPALDESGIAIKTVFTGIRKQLLDAGLPYRIDESASLAILRFSTFQIWKDLDANWRELMENPVVRHLVETPGETFDDPNGDAEPAVDEMSLRLPIAADGSQMAAVVRATSGQSFVLEGPPGTGKSQTITNLIAHALTEGKKILFVAEKQAALEVVKRRLEAIGLGAFTLELHGAKQSMNSIREQLRAGLEQRVAVDQVAWDATDARLRSAIIELERYPSLVHETNAHGYSVWSAYDATIALGEGPTATIPLPWLRSTPTIDIAQTTRDYSDAASRFGLRPGHHWLISGTQTADRLNADQLSNALQTLATARDRVEQLSAEWRSALDGLRPAAGLSAVVRLLGTRDQGLLPEPGHVAYIDRPSWRTTVAELGERLAAYRSTHERTLADATREAIELPELGEFVERSTKLDAAWFFPELRRRSMRKRIEPLLSPGVTIPAERFTEFLTALRAVRAEAEPLIANARETAGLRLPTQWLPYLPGAATHLSEARFAADNIVWLTTYAHDAALLLPTIGARDAETLRQLDGAWNQWLAAIDGSAVTVGHWLGQRPWVEAWDHDDPNWRRDLESTGLLQLQRFAETRRLLANLSSSGLSVFADQLAAVVIAPTDAPEALLRGLAIASLSERVAAGGLDSFDGDSLDRAASSYLEQSATSRENLRSAIAARLIAERPFDVTNLRGEVAELKRQIDRKRGGLSFREVTRRYPRALTSVVPCFLMSPGSVAHFLDASSIEFDLVIFDEASQIRVPQAIGSMGRGKAVIVVGDSKQMPPTRIMQVDASQDSSASQDELVVEDLESILSEAVESGLPQLWLSWHYRSQNESLIAFSNRTYYDGKLVSLPSPVIDDSSGLSWRRVDGTFDRGRSRTNEVEAQAIVDEIGARLRDPATREDSIGVVCFNIQQRDLILNKLEDSPDLLIRSALTAEAGEALFVKNLENVQGDERDTILFSLAFSKDEKTGVLPLNFGPLNLTGGERRLNVAITRARKQIVLFSSFDPSDIDLKRSNSRAIADLKSYLTFAATPASERRRIDEGHEQSHSRFVEELAAAIRADGYDVDTHLGLSTFTVDLAVRAKGAVDWRLAIMVDGVGWASRPSVSDREGSSQLLIDIMGWPSTMRVWLPAWLRDRRAVLDRVRDLMEQPIAVKPQFVPTAEVAAPTLAVSQLAASTSALRLPDFVSAPDSVIASQSVLNNMRMAEPAIVRIATEVLEVEGPIPVARLVSTVARRFGYSRIGAAKQAEIAEIVHAQFTVSSGFCWPSGIEPATWRGARRSPSSAIRALVEVSPHEIANVMELLIRESFSMSIDDLLKQTSDVLGYGRLTEQGRKWLSDAAQLAKSDGRIALENDRFVAGES